MEDRSVENMQTEAQREQDRKYRKKIKRSMRYGKKV